jgi:hypothetical protein
MRDVAEKVGPIQAESDVREDGSRNIIRTVPMPDDVSAIAGFTSS